MYPTKATKISSSFDYLNTLLIMIDCFIIWQDFQL
jgi:hypothetical protein